MIRGAAEAEAAAVALQPPRVAISMAARTEVRLTGVVVGSAPEVAPEAVLPMLAGPRNIVAGAVELLYWRTPADTRCCGTTPFLRRLLQFFRVPIVAPHETT